MAIYGVGYSLSSLFTLGSTESRFLHLSRSGIAKAGIMTQKQAKGITLTSETLILIS